MKYDIFAPWNSLDPWQIKYINTKGNCFLLCGRQSGKTAAMSIKFGKRAAENPKRIILMLAYTEKQAYNLFFKTLMYLEAKYPKMIKKGRYKPTKHKIYLKNDSIIMCFAAGLTGEGIRTYTVTDLVIDEAAPMAREVFIATMPMLSVTKGNVDMSSTPRGKQGYYYECSKRDDFTKFYVSAEDCPRHSKKFLKAEQDRMSKLEYAQEYLAKFLDDLRRVFSDEWIKKVCIAERRKSILPNQTYYYGGDVARRDKDKFAHGIIHKVNQDKYIQVENLTTNEIPITQSSRTIIAFNVQYDFKKIFIDSGGMGITVCDILRENDDTKRKVVEINNASRRYEEEGKEIKRGILKEDLYENTIMLGDLNKLELLNEEDVKISLQSVQYEIINGKVRYFGNDTHIVEAVNRALWGAKDKSLNIWIR